MKKLTLTKNPNLSKGSFWSLGRTSLPSLISGWSYPHTTSLTCNSKQGLEKLQQKWGSSHSEENSKACAEKVCQIQAMGMGTKKFWPKMGAKNSGQKWKLTVVALKTSCLRISSMEPRAFWTRGPAPDIWFTEAWWLRWSRFYQTILSLLIVLLITVQLSPVIFLIVE